MAVKMEFKHKFLKKIKMDIANEEKWKCEAIELLQKNGITDIENHPSIARFNNKISKLKKEVDDFNEDSIEFKKYCTKHEKTILKKADIEPSKTNVGKEDRWADVKAENFLKKELNWMLRSNNTIPNYIRENLKKMPNNKGYLCKGVFHFGHLEPEEPRDVKIVFEKNHEKLLIHEISQESYKIYEKQNRMSNRNLIYVHNNS